MAAAANGMALHGGLIPYTGTFFVFTDYMRPAHPHRRDHPRARHPRADPRFHRPRRGRPDPPADRTPGQPARHAAPACLPPGRRDGGGGMLGTGDPPHRRPQPAGADPPGAADDAHRDHRELLRARRLRAGRGGRPARRHADRHRLGGIDRDGRPRRAGRARASASPSSRCPAGSCLRCRTKRIVPPCWAARRAIGIEAAGGFGWERWLGTDGVFIGMTGFGASAPYEVLYRHFGITPEAIVAAVRRKLGCRQHADDQCPRRDAVSGRARRARKGY